MGFFSIFNRKTPEQPQNILPDKPEESLTEQTSPQPATASLFSDNHSTGIEAIYNFLQDDYETKGFNDALTNPDDSYKQDNIRLIRFDLQILIQKVSTYYEDLSSELDLHIATRSRAGLIDLVQELETRKQMVGEHKTKVAQIQAGLQDENSLSNRIILSYQRGFMRGLSALSQSKVLNKRI
jgi:hypothetical protein